MALLQRHRRCLVRSMAAGRERKVRRSHDLPTMNSFYPGFESDNWYAMFFPAGTPKEIVAKLIKARNIKL